MTTSTSYRRPATAGADPSFWTRSLHPDAAIKARPSLTVRTHRSRSRIRSSADTYANPRSRSFSPPPSAIVSAAPTLVPSAFSTLPESSTNRASFVFSAADSHQIHDPVSGDHIRLLVPDPLKEPERRDSQKFPSSSPSHLMGSPSKASTGTKAVPSTYDTVRSRETRSSLGFHSDYGRIGKNPAIGHYQLAVRDGRKLHTNNLEKAPYPMSYDKSVIDLECLNTRFIKHLRHGSMSFIDYSSDPSSDLLPHPTNCLDLGCGLGTWILDAAQEWPSCNFVGFDLISNQVPSYLLSDSVAARVEWVHGNFLTTKLPFEDDEFDHIHVQGVAKGVPENKWHNLFQELDRVLSPGGAIEVIDEDMIFPVSRAFSAALHPTQSFTPLSSDPTWMGESIAEGSSSYKHKHRPSVQSDSSIRTRHNHSLLESLYIGLYNRRFINVKPTAILPSVFTTYFRKVTMSPVLTLSMPPLPPPKPRAPILAVSSTLIDSLGLASPLSATTSLSERVDSQHNADEHSPSSAGLSRTLSGQSEDDWQHDFSQGIPSERVRSSSDASVRSIMQVMQASDVPPVPPLPGAYLPTPQEAASEVTLFDEEDSSTIAHFPTYSLELDDMPLDTSNQLIDKATLNTQHPRALCMHLFHQYSCVLACQDAMWEELKYRIINDPVELEESWGWEIDESDTTFDSAREKFDGLIHRFKQEMEQRCAFWAEECEDLGWKYPAQDVLNKAEEMEDSRFRKSMDQVRRDVALGMVPQDGPCRSIRVLVGIKD